MLSGSRISQQFRDHHSLQLGFCGFNSNWSNCCRYRSFKPSHLSSSFVLSFPFSFGRNIVQFPFRSSKRFFRFKLLPATHSYSSSASLHPSVSNTNNDDDPARVSVVNNESCVRSAIHAPPLLSGCLSPAGDVPDPPSARLSPVAGGIVALGKFDALHIGHRELAIQAAEIGVPFLLSFVGMAEILGWEPRAPIVAKCDRKRILSSWGHLCHNVIPKEFQIEFSTVRYLTPRQFVEKLSEELGVRGVVAGQNYRFGYKAAGDASDLVHLCAEFGMSACIIDSVMDKNQDSEDINCTNSKEKGQVSSTRVCHALAKGDMKYASELLGRRHRLMLGVENKERFFSGGKRLSAPRSCLLNLPPCEGVYEDCCLVIGEENVVVPCRVIIDTTDIHVESDELALAPHSHVTAQNMELLGIEFGDSSVLS
ncbi:FAD synthetase 1, chloroplastic-like isoform X1 [Henckelia pumila]|uniref:FAD synthetase 1, chloroplastic-like isoform X1 n=1 Tax=Henckelia pumila TaxID=405737 RepID=UPI003C6E79CE